MASTLAAIKAASHAKDAREKRDTDFHKTALVLAREYLRANGYSKSCDALAKEVGSGLEKLELAEQRVVELEQRMPALVLERDNARAALITRGLAEMVRLGLAKGAKFETMMGLSGLGDLTLTCNGTHMSF